MANFPGLILTDAGRDILAQAIAGEDLVFTRVALGDGLAPANPEGLATLVSEKRNAPIQSFAVIGNGTSRIRAIVTNVGLTAGFFAREVGVFATDPDTGSETLYAYANAGTQADYLPAEGGATIVEQLFDLITVVDTASSVTAVIDDSIIYATKDEVTGVAIEGPTLVFPGSTNTYTMTNFSSFAAYSVSSDIGTATISGDTITLVIDAGQASGGLNMIVTRDGYEYVFRIAIGEQSVAQPLIENPAEGVTDVGSGVTITTSEFLTYPENADTHASTDWQVATDTGFTAIVFESLADASNLEAIAVPSGTFDPSTTYYARARHNGTALGASAYSATRTFTTKAAFYPTTEVGKLVPSDGLSAGDFFGFAVSVDDSYAIVGAYPAGEAYVFERNGVGDWVNVQTISPPAGVGADDFGWSVSISGNRAIVGMPGGIHPGVAFIYERDGGGSWNLSATISPTDGVNYDDFGFSCAIDGDYAVVGAERHANADGAAYVYKRDAGGSWGFLQKLSPETTIGDVLFGHAVAISGNYIAVGSAGHYVTASNQGSVSIFEKNSSDVWAREAFFYGSASGNKLGWSVDIDGDRCVAGAIPGRYVEIYDRNGLGDWSKSSTITAADSPTSYFGQSVGVSGDYIIVGDTLNDNSGLTDNGAAYVFGKNVSGSWSQLEKFIASDALSGDQFGYSVSISGSYALSGTYRRDDSGSNSGAVYVFE